MSNTFAIIPQNKYNIWDMVSKGLINENDVSENGKLLPNINVNNIRSTNYNRRVIQNDILSTSYIVPVNDTPPRTIRTVNNIRSTRYTSSANNTQITAKNVQTMDSNTTSDIQNNSCVICLSREKKYAITPCNHFCLCELCCNKIDNKCPICRKRNIGLMRIYN